MKKYTHSSFSVTQLLKIDLIIADLYTIVSIVILVSCLAFCVCGINKVDMHSRRGYITS